MDDRTYELVKLALYGFGGFMAVSMVLGICWFIFVASRMKKTHDEVFRGFRNLR